LALAPQPEVVYAAVRDPLFRRRGLAGRALYLLPRSGIGSRTLETAPVPPAVQAAYALGLRALLDVPPRDDGELRTLRLAPDAYADWLDFARAVESMMADGARLEHMRDCAGKLAGTAARVAAVMHAIEHAGSDVRAEAVPIARETMARALALASVALEHAEAVYEAAGADEGMDDAAYVWRWLRRHWSPGVTVRDVHRGCRALHHVEAVEAALAELERRGYLRVERVERPGRGRPPSPRVTLRAELGPASA